MTKIRNLFLITGIAIMLISIGIAYGQGVPQSITELESAFTGFEIFLTDLNNQVQDHEGRITTLEAGLTITTVINQPFNLTAGSFQSFSVSCSNGDIVLNGGFQTSPTDNDLEINQLVLSDQKGQQPRMTLDVTNNGDSALTITPRVDCITP